MKLKKKNTHTHTHTTTALFIVFKGLSLGKKNKNLIKKQRSQAVTMHARIIF